MMVALLPRLLLLSTDPVFAFSIGVIGAILMLLLLALINGRRIDELAAPRTGILRAAEEEADAIVAEAKRQARALVGRAETASAQFSADRAKEDVALERTHAETLKALREGFEQYARDASAALRESAETARNALTGDIGVLGESARDEMRAAARTGAERFRERLDEAFAVELQSAHEAAQAYAQARRTAVDENIRALVAETTRIVLGQVLPEETHAALVFAALSEAKAARVF